MSQADRGRDVPPAPLRTTSLLARPPWKPRARQVGRWAGEMSTPRTLTSKGQSHRVKRRSFQSTVPGSPALGSLRNGLWSAAIAKPPCSSRIFNGQPQEQAAAIQQ
ncbi:hypothetical protein AAFF_G00077550 [Aldrovandia affinis]|uniref:Uncharacterized protein n=1 Tax=Aldrovandia affinis TaxID=143900 RepID=A0AAD7WCN3_9TELE|nr:hypothetical protein AAFF_G00077550 [Aldrovandia affinis]